jgi:hypothetical protein
VIDAVLDDSFRRARNRHPRPLGQPSSAQRVRLVHRRAGQSAHRVSVAADEADLDAAAPIATYADLVVAADTIPYLWAKSYALLTYGIACCDADPLGARDAMQRG